ncbi:AMP-binding protein [Kordiimonas sp.]|uniref:AMP-binding protein n=1 Tax=Kordiimonas sp. TaxID=1970157 RepID=UPI003A931262
MISRQISYENGATATPLRFQTIGQALDDAVGLYGDRPALVVRHQKIHWTYAELAQAATDFAAGLLSLGLKPGDRLGIWAPNCAEWVVTQLATAKIGVVLVTINPAYRRSELCYVLNKVGCRAIVTATRFKTSDYISMLQDLGALSDETARNQVPTLEQVIAISHMPPPGYLSFSQVMSRHTPAAHAEVGEVGAKLKPDDAINIQFTSGTTGLPKGATLTHHNILNNGFFVAERQCLIEEDRLCIPVPLYHCFGMVMGVLGALTHGVCMVFPSEAFDASAVLKAVSEEKCTALYGVPTMFIAMLQHEDFDSFDLSRLRTGVMAGSPCPVEVMKRVVSDMHMDEVTICYGMTETSPVSLQSTTDDPIEKRVSTVGKIHPHVEVKIVDESGGTVERGKQGELCTRGYSVMQGYWDDAEQTAKAIDTAGWMHTGDLAVMDGDGYVNITGRVKDMIIRGGENIYPREIEEFLYSHTEIQDVQVFGVPDERFGEEVCCWVIAVEGSTLNDEQIRSYCKGQIAHYKVPRHIRLVREYPMTVTGKIQKFVMREAMLDELGRDEQQTA